LAELRATQCRAGQKGRTVRRKRRVLRRSAVERQTPGGNQVSQARFVLTPEARQDLLEIWDYISTTIFRRASGIGGHPAPFWRPPHADADSASVNGPRRRQERL